MRSLRRCEDPLAPGEQNSRGENIVLQVRLSANQTVEDELRDQGSDTVVAKAASMDRSRDKVVAKRMHRDQRRQHARVAEVVREKATRQRRASSRLTGEHLDFAPCDLFAQERKSEAGEVRAATDTADD